MKKIILSNIIVLLVILIIFSSGTFSTSTISNKNNLTDDKIKIYYPIVKFEWNIHDTKLNWIDSGLFRGLLSIDEVSYSFEGKDGFKFDISLGFWSKYEIDYGSIHVDPLFRPEFDILSGDTITWNLIMFNDDMNSEDIWSRYAFGVWIEKAG
jgi:hypothetical protein